jgi:tRNA pseudouridine55 synthase
MSGLIVLNKPKDISSAWSVYLLRPILGIRRVGHAGALDPFAEGVVLGCIDRACKCTEMLMGLPKHYQATVQLGVTNACHDTEQPLEPFPGACEPTCEQVRCALGQFCGEILQVPPVFSALNVRGKRAYDLARSAEPVTIEPRKIRIHSIALKEYTWPALTFEVVCGRGTYIRALVRDLGETLGCGAVCTQLRRTAVGPFDLAQAIWIRGMDKAQVQERIIPIPRMKEIVAEYKAIWPTAPTERT